MLSFHPTTLSDKPWIDAILHRTGERGCEYNFTNLYAWCDTYTLHVAQVEGCLTSYMTGVIGPSYLYPVGGDARAAVLALAEDARERGEPLRLGCLTAEHMAQLEGWFPDCFTFAPDRNGWDYLYRVERLATLSGKKLHGKRNHIHRFEESNPDWCFEVLTPDNLPECVEMERQWALENLEGNSTLRADGAALARCMARFEEMGLEGGLIRVGGRVIAFTMGEPMGAADTYAVHFEKAFGSIQGAYPIINREFARWVQANHPEVVYLNREDDMGVEGLRTAKASYYPDLMVEKYSAVQRKELD